jgi:protein phosphatase
MLTQITKDDTFVQSLIDEGRITEEEAHTHPQRSLLLRAITGQDVDPSLTVREARPGDRYLLCSDGLSGVVSDETLANTLSTYKDPRECADRLIDLALRGGGPDNITCIVADVVDVDFGDDAPIVGGAAGDGRDVTPPPDSAAARASATTLTRTAPLRVQPVAPAPVARFRGLRLTLGVIAVFAVLAGGGVLARMWVLQQYYVGANDDHVAIFQGVRGSVVGLPLQHLVERTDIALTDLPEATRNTVRDGILVTEGGLAGAQGKVALLRGSMLAPCPVPGLVAPSAALIPPTPEPQLAPSDPAAVAGGPAQAVPTDPNLAPTPTVDTTPLPTVAPQPGLNCRPVS